MSTYTPEEYTMTITLTENSIADHYAKALASSMQRTKDAMARDIFKLIVRRSREDNPYIHGALNAIREQTKTV